MYDYIEQNKRLENLRNCFSGPVFLLASGASAKYFDLENYSKYKFIVMNGAARSFVNKKTCFFAYVFTDGSFVSDSMMLIKEALHYAELFFIPFELYERYLKQIAEAEGVSHKFYFINKINRVYGKKRERDSFFSFKSVFDKELMFDYNPFFSSVNKIGFSKNILKGYFCARTIPYIALQISYFLGFQKVFLIGLDLKESSGRFYDENPLTALPTTLDQDYVKHILPSFTYMSHNVVGPEFQVFNLSADSRLPASVLEKLSAEELSEVLSNE